MLLSIGIRPAGWVLEHVIILNSEQVPCITEPAGKLAEVEVMALKIVLQSMIQIASIYEDGNSIFHIPPLYQIVSYKYTVVRGKVASTQVFIGWVLNQDVLPFCFFSSSSLRTLRRTFPMIDLGSASLNSTSFGVLYAANFCLQKSIISSSVAI